MKERMIETECPFCGHSFYIKRDTLIITTMSPLAVVRLLDRTYFSHLCSRCHKLFYLTYPLMVRNPKKRYSLLLTEQKDVSGFDPEERVVVVKNVPQFYLAFHLLENDLNFKVVLNKKKRIEDKYKKMIWFDGYDDKNHCLWFDVDGENKAVLLSKEEEKNIHIVYNQAV